jgi:hypothetical protein
MLRVTEQTRQWYSQLATMKRLAVEDAVPW